MKNFKIKIAYDGYAFYDVVNAESAEQAFEYLKWITHEDYGHIKTEETNEVATYYCPEGWTKPESREHAQWRSLGCYLKANGLDIDNEDELLNNINKLDKLMSDIGYSKKIEDRKYAFYTLTVAAYEKSNNVGLEIELSRELNKDIVS